MAQNTPPQNPYLAARQEWNERYGGIVFAAQAWRLVAMVSLTLALITTGYALWQSSQVKLVPYIVEVDKLGASAHGGFPQQIEQADNRVVRALLGDFIASFRAVTADAGVQKGYVNKLYAMLSRSDAAENKISAWFRAEGNSPFIRARTQTVSVAINSIVPLSNKTWQIDWTEFNRDRKGKELGQKRFRAIATVAIVPPQDETTIRLNPIGLYIRDINWNARL